MKAEEKMTWDELENYLAYRLAPVENGKRYWGESMEAIDEYVKAHANEALEGAAKVGRLAVINLLYPHSREELAAAVETAILALKE